MISKGRNVSSFFPSVVKCVASRDVEVKKLTYMYLSHYSSADKTTRELSLLSINSFQKDLSSAEQLIRAMSLRCLTSIGVADILPIQVLAVERCSKDISPYVRKCSANAVTKRLLSDDSTMVMGSATCAMNEIAPDRLDLLHGSYRRMCALLCDMDEWSQIIVLDVMGRYGRKYFKKPKEGRAEGIDQLRRQGRIGVTSNATAQVGTGGNSGSSPQVTLPPRTRTKIKRRVVRKAFYSDEEDESSVESVYVSDDNAEHADNVPAALSVAKDAVFVDSDEDLDKDHQLLLRSSLPLLRSRNAGVVMAVAQLHFYVGVSTIEARQSIGKAMVRICRDRREIQYVVLQSIRYLVVPAPSAFSPFINEFFVRATDPSFARMAKLDILTSLALNHQSCDAVLREFRTYVRHNDRKFVLATIRAIGRVANQFRAKSFNGENVGLNCLRGLLTLIGASRHADVVGGAIVEVRRILQAVKLSGLDPGGETSTQEDTIRRVVCLLLSALGGEEGEEGIDDKYLDVYDVGRSLPSHAVASLVWIVGELSAGWMEDFDQIMGGRGKDVNNEIVRLAAHRFPGLDPEVKLQALHLCSKLLLKSSEPGGDLVGVCEYIVDMGACDVDHDVRDRARFEKGVLSSSIGWRRGEGGGGGGDGAAAEGELLGGGGVEVAEGAASFSISRAAAWRILGEKKNVPSLVPIKAEDVNEFRFGTLSSLVGEKAALYEDLPDWAPEDSSGDLREPRVETQQDPFGGVFGGGGGRKFEDSSESDDDSSSSSSGSSSDGSSSEESSSEEEEETESGEESSSEEESSSDSESDESSDEEDDDSSSAGEGMAAPAATNTVTTTRTTESLLPGLRQEEAGGVEGGLLEVAGGLKVTYAVARGVYSQQQIASMGLSMNTTVLSVTFTNARTDGGVIRRIRVLCRAGLKKSVVPQEVASLKPGEQAVALLGMDFGMGMSKDGGVKIDCKSDRGSYSVDFKVPMEEKLIPLPMSGEAFAKTLGQLGGFHKNSLVIEVGGGGGGGMKKCPEVIMDLCALGLVDGEAEVGEDGSWRGAATVGVTGSDKVLVVVKGKVGGGGNIYLDVHADNTMVGTAMLGVLKKGILDGFGGRGGGNESIEL
ncbi:hypothetical protein TrRE_jg6179 [Triparma retinervis]|uniref:AP-3 complex subunit beta n=1 Tax=Triparma retinervis TaxID=2557542 RepID=A0A9W7G9R7_9STRA|nr:hypothetical protein TrRE_jg6179 [Triparma retinervis]